MAAATTCETEVRGLHRFFEQWFRGHADPGAIDRLDRALAPGFELVSPAGDVLDREEVVEGVRDSYGEYAEERFEVEIGSVESVWTGEVDVVRYEEWQSTLDDRSGRISTATFREGNGPNGVVWTYLHETWIGE